MKTSKDYMTEANAVVPRLSHDEALAKHAAGAVFVDVRDSASIANTGTVAGALRIPRGMIEFIADPATAMHNPALSQNEDIVLICGAGGQAALAGKTLLDMGYTKVSNAGGVPDWKTNGGPSEA